MYKTKFSFILLILVALLVLAFKSFTIQKSTENWTEKQLIEPSDLAKIINDTKAPKPIIYSIGTGGNIKGAIQIGAAEEKENLDKLKSALSKLNRNTNIVIFCGCCPFENCPNIRPAFNLLNEMKFTNHKLLNLSHNLKADWIDKGYPMNE